MPSRSRPRRISAAPATRGRPRPCCCASSTAMKPRSQQQCARSSAVPRSGRHQPRGGDGQRHPTAPVARPQVRLSRRRSAVPGLLLHGRHHPARHVASARRKSRDMAGQRPARGQCLPRRRRQPAPADPVRCRDPERKSAAPRPWARDILERSVALGGSITGEHGVGLEKLQQMPCQFTGGAAAARGDQGGL